MIVRSESFVRRVARPIVATLAVLSLAPVSAGAHEWWLQPSRYGAAPGDTVAIAAFAGTGFRGDRKPYPAPRVRRFVLRGPREIDLSSAGTNGDLTFARFVEADAGGSVVAFQSDYVPIELPAAEFDVYLRTEGLTAPLAARARLGSAAGPGRERYGRCAKTWIAGSDRRRLLRPAGLELEIVPLDDPTATAAPRFVVLDHGRPLAGALVRAWRQSSIDGVRPRDAAARDSVGPVAEARTAKDGAVRLAMPADGEWLVSTVHMVPSVDRSVADWQSLWASFTFARSGSRR